MSSRSLSPDAFFFFSAVDDRCDLHSFPTRRSSDLQPRGRAHTRRLVEEVGSQHCELRERPRAPARVERSEEHTSELQSLRQLVCRLPLEKKKSRCRERRRTRRDCSAPTSAKRPCTR